MQIGRLSCLASSMTRRTCPRPKGWEELQAVSGGALVGLPLGYEAAGALPSSSARSLLEAAVADRTRRLALTAADGVGSDELVLPGGAGVPAAGSGSQG
jgi:hypothetical protein